MTAALWAGVFGAASILGCGLAAAQAPVAAPAAPSAETSAPSAATIAPIPGASSTTPVLREGVAAVVNNDIISTWDLRQRILLLIVSSGVQPTQENLPALEREALRDLIDESLQMQEIRRLEQTRRITIQPTDEEIEEDIAALAKQNNITAQQLLNSLAAAGVSPQALRQQIRAEASWRRYVGGAFASGISVGEDQINSALQRMQANATKPQYLIGEILIDSSRAGSQEAAVEGARQLIAQMQQGAPFTGVARQFSSLPTAASGGDAGWVMAGELPQAVEQALEQMRPGQLSEPIPVSGGVYIVILRDKRSGADATLVRLKQAALRLPADASEAQIAEARTKLQALRGQINSCDTLEARTAGVQGVVAGDLGETDLKDLSPAFRDAISNLQPNQVSEPIRTAAGLHLVALCSRRAAGAPAPTREDIRERLLEQELAMISRRELRDLRNSANIENK